MRTPSLRSKHTTPSQRTPQSVGSLRNPNGVLVVTPTQGK